MGPWNGAFSRSGGQGEVERGEEGTVCPEGRWQEGTAGEPRVLISSSGVRTRLTRVRGESVPDRQQAVIYDPRYRYCSWGINIEKRRTLKKQVCFHTDVCGNKKSGKEHNKGKIMRKAL